ncbi:EamA family transporter [Novosphingobium flavum]|uniref:DMT family transporter n=1 Tax=Novosphingobium TaxID=165696 RepID=UPI00163A7A24|nr:DMT family transporter [Novosphingobium sp.]MBC2662237.1 EamA family transporter [Novosphingobium aerophilum]
MTAPQAVGPAAAPASRAGAILSFAIISVVWGSTWLVIKDQISVVPPAWTITWRFVVAGAAMVLLAAVRREPLRLPPGGQSLAALVGLTQFLANYHFVYHSEAYLTSGLVAVLYALLMVPNAILSAVVLGTRVTGRFLAGSAVAVAGIALLLLHEIRLAPAADQVWLGIALSLAGLLCASCANVAQATPRAAACGTIPFITWAMLWGVLFETVWALATAGPPVFDPRPAYWGGVVYLAIFGSVLPFPLYFKLIRDMGAGRAAYTSVVTPIVAMILSTLFEGYHWTLLAAAGSVLAMVGLLIALSARRT